MDLSYNRLSSLPIDLIYLTKLDECSFEGMLMEFVPKVRIDALKPLMYEALASSVCGIQLQVYEALSY